MPANPPSQTLAVTEQSFLPIYHATVGPLFRTAARHTSGDRALAEDIVQETYLRALDTWSARGIPKVPLAWLRTVALNLIRSHHRAAAPQAITPHQLNTWLSEPTHRAAADESIESLVIWGLGQMHPDISHLIEAFHLDRRSLQHIATECNCSSKAIERRLCRARSQLRRILKPHVRPARRTNSTNTAPEGVTATSQTQETTP